MTSHPKCEICTKICFALLAFAAFFAYYQSVTLANKIHFRHRHRRRHRRHVRLKDSQNPCANLTNLINVYMSDKPIPTLTTLTTSATLRANPFSQSPSPQSNLVFSGNWQLVTGNLKPITDTYSTTQFYGRNSVVNQP